jgi:hypothetical protein
MKRSSKLIEELKMKKIFALLLTVLILMTIFISCGSLSKPSTKKTYVNSLLMGIMISETQYDAIYYSMEHYLSKHKWPTSKEDLLNNTTAKTNKTVFEKYKYLSIEYCSEKRINIHFLINQINIDNQIIHNIKGIVGIYIEDDKQVNIFRHNDKKINFSFTIGKNPYDDQKTIVLDGYSVRIYIENIDPEPVYYGTFTVKNLTINTGAGTITANNILMRDLEKYKENFKQNLQ